MVNKVRIAYFYPDLLNLYGDNGNVEVLIYRFRERGFETDVVNVSVETKINDDFMKSISVVFMGGGPDSSQKLIYQDLINKKGAYLRDYIERGGVGLFICGSYQLMGRYYKAADGSTLEGLGIFDLYTKHFGNKKPRCIGNTEAKLSDGILKDPVFKFNSKACESITGFENHGGRTYLGDGVKPFAYVTKGDGNNSEDKTEGALYKNAIGTYFHGPVLARNPHLADYVIAKSTGSGKLKELDDSLIISAYTASKKLKK